MTKPLEKVRGKGNGRGNKNVTLGKRPVEK